MIARISYIPQIIPILKRRKEIEKRVQQNRIEQQELKKKEKELIMQEIVLDAFIKHPEELKKLNKGKSR